jgi:hypothetical protein
VISGTHPRSAEVERDIFGWQLRPFHPDHHAIFGHHLAGTLWRSNPVLKREICSAFLILALAAPLFAQDSVSVAITRTKAVNTALANPVEQTKVTDCADATYPVSWQNNASLLFAPHGLQIKGVDLEGHSWSTVVPVSNVMKCEVWSAELRKGLPPDLLILNADEMGGYQSELTILFFDRNGRPHPWQATGAFTSTSSGIQQVATDQGTSNARVVVPIREGDKFSGYAYVHNLFRISAGGIEKVVGSENSAVWPQISGNAKVLVGTEANMTKSESFDADDVSPEATRTLAKVGSPDDEKPLTFSDGQTTRIPQIVVVVKSDGSRQIFFDENTPDGIAEIKKGNFSIRLKGTTCEEEECRPFIMVAKQK